MANIQVLDKQTIDKIAAGEVIDRPASIVKEMMENSIDARANAITVEIKDGGISLIRITDNGGGIEKDDVRLAFIRHATSKIKTIEDLISVSSLGFRGEALSSIAAVSQLECVTKTPEVFMGVRYVIEGGEEKTFEDVGVTAGTTFIIRNIFYNTPARRKFLKSATTEASYITAVVEHLALSHPEVSIRYIVNGNNKIFTPGNNKLKDVIYGIYGRDITKNLLEVNETGNNMSLTGYIAKPVVSRGNRNYMNYFINGRYIKSQIVNKAIEDAYKPYVMPHNYPFTALHFEIPQECIDVNVHPSKMELRFENPSAVYEFIYHTVSEALRRREMVVEATVGKEEKTEPTKQIVQDKPEIPTKQIVQDKPEIKTEQVNQEKSEIQPDEERPEEKKKVEFERLIPKLTSENNKNHPVQYGEMNPDTQCFSEGKKPEVLRETPYEQMQMFDEKFLSEGARKHHRVIGQLFDTYWLIQYDDKLYIIDQHAAHEKVLYERTMKRMRDKNFASQMINPPIILTLDDEEVLALHRFQGELSEFGFEIEEFGGKEYAIRAVPADFESLNPKDVLIDLLDSLSGESVKMNSDIFHDKIATMSCKAAIKGNNKISKEEANALIDELLLLDNPYNCPHGRPTIISMSKYEIERKFKRII